MPTRRRFPIEPILRGLRWWRGELVSLLPRFLKRGKRNGGTALLMDVTPSHIAAIRCTNGKRSELARVERTFAAPDRGSDAAAKSAKAFGALKDVVNPEVTPILIKVPSNELLIRTLTLPSAAAENLRQVIGFEMNRYTPFEEEDVYFDYRPLASAKGDPRLHLELIVVRRALVDEVMRELPAWNLRVGGAVARPEVGDDSMLLQLAPATASKSGGHVVRRFLWAANAALLAAVVAVPFLQQRQEVEALEEQVATARADAEAADELYRRFDQLRAQRNFLIDKKRNAPAVVTMLAEISAALPDTTWVQRLDLKSEKVFIRGTSSKASELIRIIEESTLFRRATFDAPVTRNPSTADEHFRLVFEIVSPRKKGDEDRDEQDTQQNAGTVAAGRRFVERR